MVRDHQPLRDPRSGNVRSAYVLVVRGPDGRPHFERFDNAASYKARLMTLTQARAGGLSIEEVVGFLDG
jgi:hypothetical protein